MFSTDFIFRQQENFVDNQKCQAGFRPLCNKILLTGCLRKCKNVGHFAIFGKINHISIGQLISKCPPFDQNTNEIF